ncbi:MAG: PH domain-containing protein [Acidobacteria bacterium]|nr:PH domain-containing protein [Acidobacteriota bacterium]
MWCHRCGKALPAESNYCNSCGMGIIAAQVGTPQNPYSSINLPYKTDKIEASISQNPDDERVIFRIRPSFYSVGKAYLGAGIFSILAMAIFGYFRLPIGISLGLSLVSFIFPLMKHVQRNRVVYTLTPSKIEIDFGFFSKTVRNIPLRNAQDVTVSATMFERIIKVGDVIVDSAAQTGKIQMRQVPDPRKHAELILQQLQQLHR